MAQRVVLIPVDDTDDDQRAMQWAVHNLLRSDGAQTGARCGRLPVIAAAAFREPVARGWAESRAQHIPDT